MSMKVVGIKIQKAVVAFNAFQFSNPILDIQLKN